MSRPDLDGSLPSWSLQALCKINRLSGSTGRDIARRTMARRIIRSCEIDDPGFPSPHVWRDQCGFICMRWQHHGDGRVNDPRTLDILVSRGQSFRGSVWRPGGVMEVVVVCEQHVEGARRLFGLFWPAANTASVGEILGLLEVRR